jgi:aspartate beta-hydroxylase
MLINPEDATDTAAQALEMAQDLARKGRTIEAESAFHKVLAMDSEQPHALRFLARAAISRGDTGSAIEWLNRLAAINREDTGVLIELGIAYRIADRFDASRYVFERILELSEGRDTTSRLLLANVLEMDERPELALTHYFRAILDAQRSGRWLDEKSTENDLRPLVVHAMQYVSEGRRAHFEAAIQPFRESPFSTALDRVDRSLDIYLRESDERPPNPLQKPTLLYVPQLGSSPVLDIARFDWLTAFKTGIAKIDGDIEACLEPSNQSGAPTFNYTDAAKVETGREFIGASSAPRTKIYQNGIPLERIRKKSPELLALLAGTPLVNITPLGPDAEIIALTPAMHVSSPPGKSNSRCVALIALSGSPRVEVTIGPESRSLEEGDALVFDSSFGAEYFNSGKSDARVLAFEIWHPDVTSLEREALAALTSSIVNFDRALEQA